MKFIVFCNRLQEVKAQPQNMVLDIFFQEDPWTKSFRQVLQRVIGIIDPLYQDD